MRLLWVLLACLCQSAALPFATTRSRRLGKCGRLQSDAAGSSDAGPAGASQLLTGRSLVECSGIGNANGGMVNPMEWDPALGSFRLQDDQSYSSAKRLKKRKIVSQMLWASFMPSGELTPDYYRYTLWRLAQRFVGATSSVFGTQALVLALGFKLNTIGIAAATSWVMKDALGKVSRIFWASKHGRKFDFNAKKWRFRSAILFATGNGFEILTYVFPSFFLATAALANALKQMAMLTSSATRNAIYKSFSRKSDNIGDITAKGEAQIAVVDLLGMMVGILLSRAISGDRVKMCAAFVVMSIMDLFCIHKEIRSVIFNSLNYERTGLILQSAFAAEAEAEAAVGAVGAVGALGANGADGAAGAGPPPSLFVTPSEVAEQEELLLPYAVSERIFATWSTLSRSVSARMLEACFGVFGPAERFCLVVHANGPRGGRLCPQVLLRRDATPTDIFRALVVTHHVLYCHKAHTQARAADRPGPGPGPAADDDDALVALVASACLYERANSPRLLAEMSRAGWDVGKFMYGSVPRRVEW